MKRRKPNKKKKRIRQEEPGDLLLHPGGSAAYSADEE
jgi:hypothetical protein